MPEDIPKKPDLLIVSDTPMWKVDGKYLAFEPVIREIENFYTLFNKITWIGFRYDNDNIQDSAVALKKASVEFIQLENIGGPGIMNKLKIIWKLPFYYFKVLAQVKKHDVVHARGPSIPAFFTLFIANKVRKPIYWYKYAGNWDLENPPFSYKLQKDTLKSQSKVTGTINGKWEGQQAHLISFENPCFTDAELKKATSIADNKSYEGPVNMIFVGRIEVLKGFDRLLEALSKFENDGSLGMVYFVGGGAKKSYYEKVANETLKVPFQFTGPLKRDALNQLYADSHIFCLPSLSEGFPKVLAESASYGCVPVVSDLSCIGQYINHGENGLLLKDISPEEIASCIKGLLEDRDLTLNMARALKKMTSKFTYEYYSKRIENEILTK